MVVENQAVGIGRTGIAHRTARFEDPVNLILVAPRAGGIGKIGRHILIVLIVRGTLRQLRNQHLVHIQKLAPAVDMGDVVPLRVNSYVIGFDA